MHEISWQRCTWFEQTYLDLSNTDTEDWRQSMPAMLGLHESAIKNFFSTAFGNNSRWSCLSLKKHDSTCQKFQKIFGKLGMSFKLRLQTELSHYDTHNAKVNMYKNWLIAKHKTTNMDWQVIKTSVLCQDCKSLNYTGGSEDCQQFQRMSFLMQLQLSKQFCLIIVFKCIGQQDISMLKISQA